jgi:hypothetical protein
MTGTAMSPRRSEVAAVDGLGQIGTWVLYYMEFWVSFWMVPSSVEFDGCVLYPTVYITARSTAFFGA